TRASGWPGCSTPSRSGDRFARVSFLRPVEHHPDDQIVAEVLEAMDRASGRQQQVAGPEPRARFLHPEEPGPAHHHVKLVAPVRLLRVEAAGRIDLHLQSTAL